MGPFPARLSPFSFLTLASHRQEVRSDGAKLQHVVVLIISNSALTRLDRSAFRAVSFPAGASSINWIVRLETRRPALEGLKHRRLLIPRVGWCHVVVWGR